MCRFIPKFIASFDPHATWIALLLATTFVVTLDFEPVRAASVFENEVWANGTNSYTICNLCDITAPISTAVPNTIFHPNPINGYGSIQGVDVGPQNGAGLTVNAAVDLPIGSTVAGSTSTAYVEFSAANPNPLSNDPFDILIRGAYGYTDGAGAVEARLWKGGRNCEACSGSPHHVLMQSGFGELPVGIWEGTVEILPHTTYTLKLNADAFAIDNGSLFIPAGRAFIDPVISTTSGDPLSITFDAGSLTNNPNFIPPDIIPEPTVCTLALTALCMAVRRYR